MKIPFLAFLLLLNSVPGSLAGPALETVSFALGSKGPFLPMLEAAKRLGWKPRINEKKATVTLNKKIFSTEKMRSFVDGRLLVSIEDLTSAGAKLRTGKDGDPLKLSFGIRSFKVTRASKSARINLAEQRLQAWEGSRLVLDSRISSGRGRSTPCGEFEAGPYKARRHYSSRYNNAFMPFSVQVTGNIFIHGFSSVPRYPASAGCIRLPYLTDGNPARFFYEWIERGTPISIVKE